MTPGGQGEVPFAEVPATSYADAMRRFAVLRPHLEENVSLAATAKHADVPLRTAQRWLARYRTDGLAGLARVPRSDSGHRRLMSELAQLIEGMALHKPRLSIAAIHRRVRSLAEKQNWTAPSYGSVYAIVRGLDPGMVTLALDGHAAWRDRFELIYHHRAGRPNAIWQADHTMLDILVLDANGNFVRPWLTTVIDDHSRAVAGYTVFTGAPSALHTSLALRQAIWRKKEPGWPVCGIPDVLYVDHGSDFTSIHLDQAAADLRIRIVHSAVARPQGRGKVERLFGTLNTELLPELPGNLVMGKPVSTPTLTLADLDVAIGRYLVGVHNTRVHSQTGTAPVTCWLGNGWLARMPDSLEDLDLLLIMVAKARIVRRDGIHFQGLRYIDAALAPYVGEPVTVRYDPRDVAEIRVFHSNRFLCRAVSPEHAGETVTLKDIQTARLAHRRFLRTQINERISCVKDFFPVRQGNKPLASPKPPTKRPKLRTYFEDD